MSTFVDRNGGWPIVSLLALVVLIGVNQRLFLAIHPLKEWRDASSYAELAKGLSETGRYDSPEIDDPSAWSPGAPFLFAASNFVAGGPSPTAARLAELVLGIITILLVYLLARRLGGMLMGSRAGPVSGLIAATIASLYPAFYFYNGTMMSEPIAAFTLTAALLLFLKALESGRLLYWAVTGLFIGLTAFTRPEFLPFAFVFAAVALYLVASSKGLRSGVVVAAVIVAVSLVPIVPWTVHNYLTLHRFVPLTTGGGKVIFIGNYLPGKGLNRNVKRELVKRYPDLRLKEFRGSSTITRKELVRTDIDPFLDRVASRYPDLPRDKALARVGRDNLLSNITEHPAAYLNMLAVKLWYMWGHPPEDHMELPKWRTFNRALLLFSLLGLVLLVKYRRRESIIFVTLLLLYTAMSMIVVSTPRRAFALMPMMIALAGVAMVWANAYLRRQVTLPTFRRKRLKTAN